MESISYWTCDTCRGKIENAQDGYVEWTIYRDCNERHRGRNLRLVHHFPASPLRGRNGCQSDPGVEHRWDNGVLHDLPLTDFLGADGLMLLLEMLAEAALPTAAVVEMIKRLHTSR